MNCTLHCQQRMSQQGIPQRLFEIVCEIASPDPRGHLTLYRKDMDYLVEWLNRFIEVGQQMFKSIANDNAEHEPALKALLEDCQRWKRDILDLAKKGGIRIICNGNTLITVYRLGK